MSSQPHEANAGKEWSIQEAEDLLGSLAGVISSRIVARPGGEIDEVHLLTTEEVGPKQTVRNVESALLAHFDLTLDHRKISVAQTSRPIPLTAPSEGTMSVVVERHVEPREERILFEGHEMETEKAHQVRVTVSVRWRGSTHEGMATAADLPRPRLGATANATLRAIEGAVSSMGGQDDDGGDAGPAPPELSLALDGVKLVEAFEQQFILVAVHAMSGREILSLAGAATVDDNLDRSVILATLQATDRWVRGKMVT